MLGLRRPGSTAGLCALRGGSLAAPARDEFIGWAAALRAEHLHLVANNTRFPILPWVGRAHLASHVLSRIAQRLSRDWRTKYGHPVYPLETFVQLDRLSAPLTGPPTGFAWGNRRPDAAGPTRWHLDQAAIKDVYLYPLQRGFRHHLQGQSATPNSQ